ncbi:hypothetical protein BKA67DRAFT_672015 [Truncatella angustata]|uniref:Uncharacterized protein n=1 Tax=Truncatella angustata TaxID=152316 RepID=A0A9P8UQ50_9PEZI|nr:uncharacterized protein BKA67DRAFT_672015 [Truncatella angustata]KAH6656261.1 hypothetical protein BKA67DRAFT_672015 [Truncatella angustata]
MADQEAPEQQGKYPARPLFVLFYLVNTWYGFSRNSGFLHVRTLEANFARESLFTMLPVYTERYGSRRAVPVVLIALMVATTVSLLVQPERFSWALLVQQFLVLVVLSCLMYPICKSDGFRSVSARIRVYLGLTVAVCLFSGEIDYWQLDGETRVSFICPRFSLAMPPLALTTVIYAVALMRGDDFVLSKTLAGRQFTPAAPMNLYVSGGDNRLPSGRDEVYRDMEDGDEESPA